MKNTHQKLARNSNSSVTNSDIQRFIAERDAALLSLDEQVIRAHSEKWGVRNADDPRVFWISIHKARTACRSLPLEARMASSMWLTARGYSSLDFGELDLKVA